MSKQSPSVARVVAILNFFGEHPQQAFTLSQVVKSLMFSRATTHAILVSLVEASYLYRRPDKTYVLGPALPSLAARAMQHFSPLAIASQEMRILADGLDVIASALFLEGDEIVVRERAASVKQLGLTELTPGQKFPAYPLGSVFLMPLSDIEIYARLDRLVPPLTEPMRQDVLSEIKCARQYGFIAALTTDDQLGKADINTSARFISEFQPDQSYVVGFLVAPVAGVSREVAFAIALRFRRAMTGAEINDAGKRLRETCDRISTFIRGKLPPPPL